MKAIESVETKTSELYEDIHPYVDVEATIQYYLKTILKDESFFKGKNILDCGFGGTGWASELFARSGASAVSGVDLNPKWREQVGDRLAKYACPVNLMTGTVLDLPFKDNYFDFVHSHGVMHHTVDWKQGVAEMVRVLKPGGSMYLGVYGKFGPIGSFIYWSLRTVAKILPYKWVAGFVKKTGFFRHSEYSLLDLMYAPKEDHLSEKEVTVHLNSLGIHDIVIQQNYKWRKGILTNPLLFTKKAHHAFWATKGN